MKLLTTPQWSKLITSLIASYLAGFIGSLFMSVDSMAWYATLDKPIFSPPGWVFGPVWMVLYACIGIALYRLWISRNEVSKTLLVLFAVHLILNALWSILFFGFISPVFAYVDIILLWIMVAALTLDMWKIDRLASTLFIPYWIWITFASFLNFAILLLN